MAHLTLKKKSKSNSFVLFLVFVEFVDDLLRFRWGFGSKCPTKWARVHFKPFITSRMPKMTRREKKLIFILIYLHLHYSHYKWQTRNSLIAINLTMPDGLMFDVYVCVCALRANCERNHKCFWISCDANATWWFVAHGITTFFMLKMNYLLVLWPYIPVTGTHLQSSH